MVPVFRLKALLDCVCGRALSLLHSSNVTHATNSPRPSLLFATLPLVCYCHCKLNEKWGPWEQGYNLLGLITL